MLSRQASLLQSFFSLSTHADINQLGILHANECLGAAKVSAHADLRSGRFYIKDRVMRYPDLGGDIEFAYIYSSNTASPWCMRAARSIKRIIEGHSITIINPDGSEQIYQFKDGVYCSTDNDGQAVLSFDPATKSYVRHHLGKREKEYFSAEHHQVTKRVDSRGLVTEYRYSGDRLDAILAPSGARYDFSWSDKTLEVTRKINGVSTPLNRYEMNEFNQLDKSITPDGYITTYHYQPDNLLHVIEQSDKTKFTVECDQSTDLNMKLKAIKLGDQESDQLKLAYSPDKTRIELPSGEEVLLTINSNSQISSIEIMGSKNRYDYYASGQLKSITHPDKSTEQFEYDEKTGQIKKHTQRDRSVIQYEYSNDAEPVLLRVSHYQAGSEVAEQVKRFIYRWHASTNTNQLCYEISHQGFVRGYDLDKNGMICGIRQYTSQPYTSDAMGKMPTSAMMNDWVACIPEAERVASTRYSSIDYSASGLPEERRDYAAIKENGQPDATKPYKQTVIKHSIDGNPLLTVLRTGMKDHPHLFTRRKFDSLKRLLLQVNGCGTAEEQRMTQSHEANQCVITAANKQQTIRKINPYGLLCETISEMQGEQEKQTEMLNIQRNSALKVNVIKHSDSTTEYEYKDVLGRINGTIGKSGQVVKIEYSQDGRYRKKTAYAHKIDKSKTEIATGWVEPPTDKDDRESYIFYGFNSKPNYEVDAENFVIEYRYNVSRQLTHTIKYSLPVTLEELQRLKSGMSLNRVPDRNHDRVHSIFYDADGNIKAEQDEAGYVKELSLSIAGKPISQYVYNTANLEFSDQYSKVQPPKVSDKDGMQYYFHNHFDECEFEIDALGYVTTREFYLDGKIKSETRHAEAVDLAKWQDKTIRPAFNNSAKDQTTTYHYDALRRIQSTRKSNGEIKTFEYDEMNNKIAETIHNDLKPGEVDGDHFRGVMTKYNKLGQVVASLNPFAAILIAGINQQFSGEEASDKCKAVWQKHAEKYEYDHDGLKIKTTDPLGKVSHHFYNEDRQLVLNIDPTGAILEKEYNAFGEEIKETHRINRIQKDELSTLKGGFLTDAIKQLISKDIDSDLTIIKVRNKRGLVNVLTESEKRRTLRYYNAFKQLQEEHLPDVDGASQKIVHEYDGRGLETKTIRSASGEDDIVTRKEYQHPLGLLTAQEDPCGGRAEWVRDQLGCVREQKQRNEDGVMVTVKSSLYDAFLRPTESKDIDGKNVLADYDDKLNVETFTLQDGVSQKIVFKNIFGDVCRELIKDGSGNIISDTLESHAPDGQVATHADGEGNKAIHHLNMVGLESEAELADGTIIKKGYNDAHVLNQIVTDQGEGDHLNLTTEFEIDAMSRTKRITDARKNHSSNEFTPHGEIKRTITTMDNGKADLLVESDIDEAGNVSGIHKGELGKLALLNTKNRRDGFGRVKAAITDPDHLALTNEYVHDKLDREIKHVDPAGYITRHYFNNMKQLRFEVKPVTKEYSALIERRYSASGKLIERRVSRTPIAVSTITDETKLAEIKATYPGSEVDQITRYLHDEFGRVLFKLRMTFDQKTKSYSVAVTEKGYDAASREIKKHAYSTPLVVKNIQDVTLENVTRWLAVPAFANLSRDRVLHKIYNKASQCRFSINQDGYVTEKIYSKVGKLITLKLYEQPYGDPAKFTPAMIPKNAVSRNHHAIFDAAGREIASIEANGLVIKKDYDANGNIIKECRFKHPVDAGLPYDELRTIVNKLNPLNADASIIEREYDSANRLIKSTDEEGYYDLFDLNAVGNIYKHTDRNKQVHIKEYDTAQRKIRERSPETLVALMKRVEGKLTYETKPLSIAKLFKLDKNGNTIKITNAEGLGPENERSVKFDYAAAKNHIGTLVKDVTVANNDFGKNAGGNETVDVSTKSILNEQGLEIAVKDENDNWTYYVRDSFGRVLFTVLKQQALIKHEYDAFGLELRTIQYDKPISFADWSSFQELTKQNEVCVMLESHPRSDNDRVMNKTYYANGLIKSEIGSEVYCYDDGKLCKASPETKKIYNRFNEVVYEATLLSPGRWAEKATWRDQAGRPILEIDENNYVTQYMRDAFGNVEVMIEYANALPDSMLKSLLDHYDKPVTDILAQVKDDNALDRIHLYEYDKRQDKVSEKLLDVEASELSFDQQNVPAMINIMRESVGKRFTISPTQKCLRVELETGVEAENIVLNEFFYNECDVGIATLDVPRTREDDQGQTQVVVPMLKTIPNAHGEAAVKQSSPKGCMKAEDGTPQFIDKASVIENLTQHDKRGKDCASQDGQGNVSEKTFTPSGLVAAKIATKSKTIKDATNQFSKTPEKAVEKIKYEPFGNPSEQYHLCDGKQEQVLFNDHNQFGEHIGSRAADTKGAEFKKRNANGAVWMDNSAGGNPKIQLTNLAGHLTGSISATEIDLSEKNPSDIPVLLAADRKTVLLENMHRDKKGRMQSYQAPSYFKSNDPNQRPTFSQILDRWNSPKIKSDSRGNETTFETDNRDNVIAEIKPERDITESDGTVTRKKTKTQFGYNMMSGTVGKLDPRGNLEAYVLDSANQMVKRILADGVIDKRYTRDAMGRIEFVWNAKNGKFSYHYDANSKVIELNLPGGRSFYYRYDECDNRIYVCSPTGSESRMNFSMNGDIIERFKHLGQLTKWIYNHRHELLLEKNPDNKNREWERDFFGNVDEHLDLSGRINSYERYFNQKPKRETTTQAPALKRSRLKHGNLPGALGVPPLMEVVDPGPLNAEINFKEAYGLTVAIEDIASDRVVQFWHDTDLRKNELTIRQLSDNRLLRHVTETHDEAGDKQTITDENYLINGIPSVARVAYGLDADSNVTRRIFDLKHSAYSNQCPRPDDLSGVCMNSFDPASRLRIMNGVLENGHTALAIGRGFLLDYGSKDGTRIRESFNESATTHRSAEIARDVENFPYDIQCNNDFKEERRLLGAGLLVGNYFYSTGAHEGDKNRNHFVFTTLNSNEWTSQEDVYDTKLASHMDWQAMPDKGQGKRWSTTTFTNSDAGYPTTIEAVLSIDHLTTKNVTAQTFVGKESLSVASISTTISNKHGDNAGTAENGFDTNLEVNSQPVGDEEPLARKLPFANTVSQGTAVFDTLYGGKVMSKVVLCNQPVRSHTSPYFAIKHGMSGATIPIIDVESNVEGYFDIRVTLAAADNDAQRHQGQNVPEQLVEVSPVRPSSGHIERDAHFGFPDSDPHFMSDRFHVAPTRLTPICLTVKAGDTLESISYGLWGNIRYADDIAEYNSLMCLQDKQLAVGSELYIPHITPDQLKHNAAMPYHKFANRIIGQLSAHVPIPMPKIHHPNFFGQIVKMIAVALIIAYAPALAGMLIPGISGMSLAAVSGVIAGLGDAAVQGVAVGLGIQERFSVAEVLETAVTAGTISPVGASGSAGAATAGSNLISTSTLMNVVKMASTQTATQLLEMGIGVRDKFDIAAIGQQIATSLVATQLAEKMQISGVKANTVPGKVAIRTATNTTSAIMNSLANHTPLNIQQLAAQTISGGVSDAVTSHLDKQVTTSTVASANEKPVTLKITSPGLKIPKPAYGEVSYNMGLLNQARMAKEHAVKIEPPHVQASTKPSLVPASNEPTAIDRMTSALMHPPRISELKRDYSEAGPVAHFGLAMVGYGAAAYFVPETLSAPVFGAIDQVFSATVLGSPVEGAMLSSMVRAGSSRIGAGLFAAGAAGYKSLESVGGVLRGVVDYSVSRLGVFGRLGAESVLNTGARQIGSVAQHNILEREAAEYYETVRALKSNYDVTKISKSTGVPEYRIHRIKNHLFNNKHILSDGSVNRFHPDIEVADAWRRLQTSNFHQQDLNLLHHEYFESKFEGIFKTDYITAHNAALDKGRAWDPYEFVTVPNTFTWRNR